MALACGVRAHHSGGLTTQIMVAEKARLFTVPYFFRVYRVLPPRLS